MNLRYLGSLFVTLAACALPDIANAQYCPGGTTYFSSNFSLAGCTIGTCWANSSFPGSTNVSGAYPGTYYACAAAAPAAGALENTLYAYDSNGNLTQTKDPLGHAYTNSYDALNRVTQVQDPATKLTKYDYNLNNALQKVTDPRLDPIATNYTINGFGETEQLVSPDTGTTINVYDSAGNIYTSTDARNVTATYTYDAVNRVTQMAYAGGGTLTFTYDVCMNGKGRLCTMVDVGQTDWVYDIRGRVAQKTQVVGGLTRVVGYHYNGAGQLDQITYPSGLVVGLQYANGRVVAITANGQTLLNQAGYFPFADVETWTWGNNQAYLRDHDLDGRISQYSRNANYVSLTIDKASLVRALTDSNNSSDNQTFDYDPLDRLITANGTTTRAFTYDDVGNRRTYTVNSVPATYNYDAASNRIANITGAQSYSYLANGSIIGDGTRTFGYNARGRMSSSTAPGLSATYNLNALGQRVKKTVTPGTSTVFVYAEDGKLLGEYDGTTGVAIAEHIYLVDLPVGVFAGGVAYQVYPDHLGTPRAVIQAGVGARWQWHNLDPFGANLPNENPAGLGTFKYNLRFPGQYFDAETGLAYNMARDYDPSIGRYVESDPIGINGGINTYAYSGGNPLSNADADGLAYFAKRPLSHTPWLGYGSCQDGGIDDRLNTEVSHEHLFFEDGKSPPNIGHGPGGLFTERNPQGYRCKSAHYDDCVMRKAVANTPPKPYCLLGKPGIPKYNCQDWADEVRREYARLMRQGPDKCGCQ